MSSILDSETLLKVEDVHLKYNLGTYGQDSIRDKFVTFVSNPFLSMSREREVHEVLKGISFDIKKGERVGILGVNGAGKTTLCRCISKMIVPQHGIISTRGTVRPIFSTSFGVMPELTGEENATLLVTFFYPLLSKYERDELVKESLDFSELGEFINVPVKNYSNGMRSRLFLSLISARPSDILILDEVFSGADMFFQRKITKRITQMMKMSGAVLFVSHSIDEIIQNSTRVIVLSDGKVYFDGDVQKGCDLYVDMCDKAKDE